MVNLSSVVNPHCSALDKMTRIHWGRTTVAAAGCIFIVLGILLGGEAQHLRDNRALEVELGIESRVRAQLRQEVRKAQAEREQSAKLQAYKADLENAGYKADFDEDLQDATPTAVMRLISRGALVHAMIHQRAGGTGLSEAVQVIFTGLAQIARLGPVFCD
jgi:hypothetical protein